MNKEGMPITKIKLGEVAGQVDFAIITIREDEELAILERFPPTSIVETSAPHSATWPYAICYIQMAGGGRHTVAMIRCLRQGTNEAQRVTGDVIRELRPKWVFTVGIAGAVPDAEFTLGDVIISSQVLDLTVTASKEGGVEEYAVSGSFLSKSAEGFIAGLGAMRNDLSGWASPTQIGVQRPQFEPLTAEIQGEVKYQEEVRKSLAKHFGGRSPRTSPTFKVRPIASSNALVKDTELVKRWRTFIRQFAAIEMEFAGVYAAARGRGHDGTSDLPVITIRGLSDIVGLKRDPQWTEYACHSAASLTRALIEHGGFGTAVSNERPSPAQPMLDLPGMVSKAKAEEHTTEKTNAQEPATEGVSKDNSIKILHLSDLHFSFWPGANTTTRRHSVEYLEGIEKVIGMVRPDHCIVTGDVTSCADDVSLARARDWFIGRITISHAADTGLGLGQREDGSIQRLTITAGNRDAEPPYSSGRTKLRHSTSLNNFTKVFGKSQDFEWIPVGKGAVMLITSELSFLGPPHISTLSAESQPTFTRRQRRQLLKNEGLRLFRLYKKGSQGKLYRHDRSRILPHQFAGALKILVSHFPLVGEVEDLGVRQSTFNRLALANAMIGVRIILCGHQHSPMFEDDLVRHLLKPREEARYSFNCFRRLIGINELPPQFTLRGNRMSFNLSAIILIIYKSIKSKLKGRDVARTGQSGPRGAIEQLTEILVSSIKQPGELTTTALEYLSRLPEEDRTLFDRNEFIEIQTALEYKLTIEQRRRLALAVKSKSITKALSVFKRTRIVQRRCGSSGKFRPPHSPERCLLFHNICYDDRYYRMRTEYWRWTGNEFTLGDDPHDDLDEVTIRPA